MSVQDTLPSVVSSRKRKNILPQHSRNKKQNRVLEERGNTKQISRHGTSEGQHTNANTAMHCYGVKKD
jgi:hypothetical protein